MERQRYYTAADGMIYKRIVDGVIVGRSLYLGKFIDGSVDVIENYEEVVDENLQKKNEEFNKKMNEYRNRMMVGYEARHQEMTEELDASDNYQINTENK